MMSDPAMPHPVLAAIAARCTATLPGASVRQTPHTITIGINGETLYVSPGDQAERADLARVVLWTEVLSARHLPNAAQREIANRYVADQLLTSGFAMGSDTKRHLLVLGRNIEVAALSDDAIPDLVHALISELSIAEATAERVASEVRGEH